MSNPAFNFAEKNMEKDIVIDGNNVMTVKGTLNITLSMGLLMLLSAALTWTKLMSGYTDMGSMMMFGGGIAGFVL